MIDILRRRAASAKRPPPSRSTSIAEEGLAHLSTSPRPYDTPCPDGRCFLAEMPGEILARIFLKLDRISLTRCYRLCRDLNEFLTTNTAISLHHILLSNSLRINPHALSISDNTNVAPPSKAELLETLRKRLERFRHGRPRQVAHVDFKEVEGNLYEYLEGVLLRGISPVQVGSRSVAQELAIYDLRQLSEWEDADVETVRPGSPDAVEDDLEDVEETTESEAGREIRRSKRFGFDICEFAVDPGQDLLVVVEVRHMPNGRRWSMLFHLFSLSTFEPHPRAAFETMTWPEALSQPRISLGFQICDDGLFVLKHNAPGGPYDQICGWQWTTGRLGVTLRAYPTMSFESFVLVSPSSFVVPTIVTHLDPTSETQDELENPSDLSWTHHLHLYAFPPFSTVKVSPQEPIPPPHAATHVATLDLPNFHVDLLAEIPPVRMTIRTDPPPRHNFPTHPVHNVPRFVPTPESGIMIMEFYCQLPRQPHPHYVMCFSKSTLTQYLPAPTSPLLSQAFPRPAPVVSWSGFAPHVRVFGPDLLPTSWVCYVYQDRYVAPFEDLGESFVRIYDFDPLRVRREICARTHADLDAGGHGSNVKRSFSLRRRFSGASDTPDIDGNRDGITLVTAPSVIKGNRLLPDGLKTGEKFPCLYVDQPSVGDVALLDGERIVLVGEEEDVPWNQDPTTTLTVWDF